MLFRKKNVFFTYHQDWKVQILKKINQNRYNVSFLAPAKEIDYNQFDLIVPLSIADQMWLHENHAELLLKKTIVPSPHCIALINDKFVFNQYLINNSFAEFVPKINVSNQYPYVLKKREGEWGENIFIINSEEEERNIMHLLSDDNYFTQECIESEKEYATHILFYKKIHYCFTREYTFSSDKFVKGGNGNWEVLKTVDTLFKDTFAKILESLDYQGLCCFNYKIINNKPYIFEINPRFGGSLTVDVNNMLKAQLKLLKSLKRLSR